MKKVTLISRYLLSAFLVLFGLNKFLQFMEPPIPPEAVGYWTGIGSVHMMPVLGVIFLVTAVLLLTNKMVGLATVTLAAIAFNILLYHLLLDPANIGGGFVMTVLLALVMIGNKEKYQTLLS